MKTREQLIDELQGYPQELHDRLTNYNYWKQKVKQLESRLVEQDGWNLSSTRQKTPQIMQIEKELEQARKKLDRAETKVAVCQARFDANKANAQLVGPSTGIVVIFVPQEKKR